MNEVKNTQVTTPLVNPAASSKGAAKTQVVQPEPADGKLLPVTEKKSATNGLEHTEAVREQVEAAVASINDFVQSVQRDLRFTVDEELNRTIIRVIDSESGELVRQIPEEVFLELARKLKDDGELQLVNALG